MRVLVLFLLLAGCNHDASNEADLSVAADLSVRPDLRVSVDGGGRHCRQRDQTLQCGPRQCPIGAWCDQRDPANPVCRCGADITLNTPDCLCGPPMSLESPGCYEGPAGCA